MDQFNSSQVLGTFVSGTSCVFSCADALSARCSEVLSSRLRNDARRLHLGVTVTKGRRQRNVTSRNQDRPGLFVCFSAGPQTTPGVIARKILTSPPCRWELWLVSQNRIFWYLKYLPSDNAKAQAHEHRATLEVICVSCVIHTMCMTQTNFMRPG